ncbi:MAG: hypothetical protein LRY69_06140 [Gammaproteobacteria bacterium]|nr:hypothetical protein [Gammaproteobacteria bacterium]
MPTSQKTQILISSKTSIDITQRPNFIRSILELPSKGLETAFALEPLKGRIVSEDSGEYFRQFVPYVLEEVRANICAQRNIIAKKKSPAFSNLFTSGSKQNRRL